MNTDKLTSVYVSGLPVDITDQEFKDLMNKCGLVMYDPRTRKPKLKLYKGKTGENKGDGLCCYIKVRMPESPYHSHCLSARHCHLFSVAGTSLTFDQDYIL